ncbi:hypothetical protein EBT31_02365 [bacterium]|nr:hypothetical protein [bacterium]
MKDEALRLALDALEEINKLSIGENAICLPAEIDTAMDAIKQALAQPEPEPVKVMGFDCVCGRRMVVESDNGVVASPPKRKWQGLTDDEIDLLEELYAPPVHPDFVNDADHCLELIRHVEAKLKEKNNG